MPAITSLEDLKAAQKEGLSIYAMLYGFLRTRDTNHGHGFNRIGWKNVCKLWLEDRTAEQLKGEGRNGK